MFKRLLCALPLAALTLPAQAQLARSFSSATYTGAGASLVDSDFKNLKSAYNLEALGGFNITPNQPWGRISAELNISITVSPGKNEGPAQTTTTPGSGGGLLGGGTAGSSSTESGRFTQSNNDLQTQVFSLSGAYRTPGPLYAIGTAGYSLLNTSIEEIQDHGRGAFTFGGGLGFKFGEETAAVEVLYTHVGEDLQNISLRFVY